jgi:ATP-dependent RNA helicase DeaD
MTFSDLGLHPALARALTTRGYQTPTSVQAAVLDPACAERDLVVSSQTGSGKTIAFGAALAQTLLGAEAKHRPGEKPVALVIVPTRELSAQVREELGWLLAGTGLRLGSFTGGTQVSGDLRALHRGVDLVIGTPGRLVDLVKRTRLDLSAVKVVVLDEADEMLDLGFREDLELLLKAAPVDRRTLMLSATLPSEIRSLAKKFQRDALAVDPRAQKTAAGAKGLAESPSQPVQAGHDDITYVAHLIAGGDRFAAVVNVLRASDASRAIVFCTTREAVGELHQALLGRGFLATAISGDRAQAERDRALEQVRRGEARVLVATNVAARGLHLPDVDLIIHADLPLNADSLTHRSGRTGRAGRKGTAVVIATLTERRKAERLLSAAHVKALWTAPPSERDIAAAARERFVEELLAETPVEEKDVADGEADAADLIERSAGKISADQLLRRLLSRELARLPGGEPLRPVTLPSAGGERGGDDLGRRSPAELSRDGVLFRVNLGARDQADPRWMLPLICRRGGVTRRDVGAIRIGPQETFFEIAGPAARDFALAASQTDPRAPHVRMERADEAERSGGGGGIGGGSGGGARGAPRGHAHAPRPHHAAPHAAPRAGAPHAAPRAGAPHRPAAHRGGPAAGLGAGAPGGQRLFQPKGKRGKEK